MIAYREIPQPVTKSTMPDPPSASNIMNGQGELAVRQYAGGAVEFAAPAFS
jgi:hypothetical protein